MAEEIDPKRTQQLVHVVIIALVEDQANGSPIVMLHDKEANRVLPIWIGDPEARAIAVALNKMRVPRPLTHKLLLNVLAGIGAKLLKIVVDRLQHNTYFSSIYIQQAGYIVAVDARPSDAIALALEASVPMFVSKEIMDKSSHPNPFPGPAMPQEKGGIKREMKPEEVVKLRELLEKARQMEEKSTG